jgi:hypothetical protein
MEAKSASEMSAHFYRFTRRRIQEEKYLVH